MVNAKQQQAGRQWEQEELSRLKLTCRFLPVDRLGERKDGIFLEK